MTKKTKNKAAKARKRPVKKKKEEATLKSKATKELRARHLASICAEVESLRSANS